MDLLIRNISVITQNKNRDIMHNCNIFIKDGLVSDIITWGSIRKYLNLWCDVINWEDFFLCPWFINMHVHLWESIYKNIFQIFFCLEDYLYKTNEISRSQYSIIEGKRRNVAKYSIKEMIMSGVTTISWWRVHDYSKDFWIRSSSFYILMDTPKLSSYLTDLFDKISIAVESKKIQWIFIHSLNYIDLDLLKTVKKLMDKYTSLKLWIHLSETLKQEDKIEKNYGVKSLNILKGYWLLNSRLIIVHGNNFSKADIKTISDRKCSIVHCLKSNLKVADNTPNIVYMRKKWINVSIATDWLITSWWLDLIDEMNFNYLYHNRFWYNKLSSQDIFDMVTISPSKMLWMTDIWTIEIWKKADLLLFKKEWGMNYINDIVYYKKHPYWVIINWLCKVWNYNLIDSWSNIDWMFFNVLSKIDENNTD